jgi:predicted LPLAT superfamily acyltransferase
MTSPTTQQPPQAQTAPPADAPPLDPPPRSRGRWGAPRFGYRINALVLWIASRALWLGYAVVAIAAFGFFLFLPRARRASIAYLDRLHAARGNTSRRNPLTRAWQTYRHMRAVGILMLDRALILATPGHGFHMECEGLLHLAHANRADNGRAGLLLLSAHFGMAEIAVPYLALMGINRPTHLVMYQDASDGTERFHARHRRMLENVSIISTTDPLAAGIKIIGALKKGEVVAMRADRTLAGRAIPVTFLGSRITLPAGPFLAATLRGAPTVYIYTCRTGYRRYRCIIAPGYPPATPAPEGEAPLPRDAHLAAAAQHFATHLESLLPRHPHQWSNFYDLWQSQKP